jgi:hypothetical protein
MLNPQDATAEVTGQNRRIYASVNDNGGSPDGLPLLCATAQYRRGRNRGIP